MKSCYCILYSYMIFLTLFLYGLQNIFQCCIQHFKPIESIPYQLNSFKSSEHFVLWNLLCTISYTPITLYASIIYGWENIVYIGLLNISLYLLCASAALMY